MIKLSISKDALSYWNFSYLWEIAGIEKGSGTTGWVRASFYNKKAN